YGVTMTKSTQAIIHAQIISGLLEKGTFRFKVTGNCMWPLIQKGDWVFVQPVLTDPEIQTGEIVLMDHGVDFVVHRLVGINNSEIITQGDWSKFPDPPVKRERILGKVILIEKSWCRLCLTNPIIHCINRILYHISCLYQKFYGNKGVKNESFNHPSTQ
ncbi:MAG: S24/S26 family peptidase, partial [Anaerolineaceae bacterium]|nr:S24/S26 family peptidase [Anaerolineaceae bacterium]